MERTVIHILYYIKMYRIVRYVIHIKRNYGNDKH